MQGDSIVVRGKEEDAQEYMAEKRLKLAKMRSEIALHEFDRTMAIYHKHQHKPRGQYVGHNPAVDYETGDLQNIR